MIASGYIRVNNNGCFEVSKASYRKDLTFVASKARTMSAAAMAIQDDSADYD